MTHPSHKGHPENKSAQTQSSKKEEQMPMKDTARGGVAGPGVMWGINWPGAITGWVAALLMNLILIAIAGAILGPLVISTITLKLFTTTAGILSAIILLAIGFISYFVGGWVAGRVAGFNGVLNGIMTVVTGIVVAIILGIVGVVFASNVTALAGTIPPGLIGSITSFISIGGIIMLIANLLGAALGGWLGARTAIMRVMKPTTATQT